MDLICLTCGEPWEVDHVLHDAPADFERKGCLITRCPACAGRLPTLTESDRERLGELAEVAVLHGSDIDGFAAFLEDLGSATLDE
jgi:hypothetical protein